MLDAMRQIYLKLFGLANERGFRRLSFETKENLSSERLGHLEKKVDLLMQKLDSTDEA